MDYSSLKLLALGKNAATCYQSLDSQGSATALELSRRLDSPKRSVYHALNKLQNMGFVETLGFYTPHVSYFRAVRLDKALENLAIYQRRVVCELINKQIERSINQQTHAGRVRISKRDWR